MLSVCSESCENDSAVLVLQSRPFLEIFGWALIQKKVRPGAGSESLECRIRRLYVDGNFVSMDRQKLL